MAFCGVLIFAVIWYGSLRHANWNKLVYDTFYLAWFYDARTVS